MSGLLLQEGDLDQSLSPLQRESMQMIVASGDLLLTVVNDVLDYAKLETGNVDINPRPSNMQEMLNSLIHAMEMKDHEEHVSILTNLDPKLPEFVTIDSQRMSQILFNLLGNALKFSKKGGTIEVDVEIGTSSLASRKRGYVFTPAERERQALLMNQQRSYSMSSTFSADGMNDVLQIDDHAYDSETGKETKQIHDDPLYVGPTIRFCVKDYGKGIESRDFGKIFQPFRQASTEVEQVFGGTGLGVSISPSVFRLPLQESLFLLEKMSSLIFFSLFL
jgi:signal transduction histidine kinase